MAVSDYQVQVVSDSALMSHSLSERLSELPCSDPSSLEEAAREVLLSPPAIRERKISSDKEDMIVVLKKAPKIISSLRKLAPAAVIVGFKLLSKVSEEELAQAGHALLIKNECDFVFANDIQSVHGDDHEGILVSKDGPDESASGKDAIAALIVERVLKLLP